MQNYNPLFNRIFGDEEVPNSQPNPILELDFDEESERLIREAIVDIAQNYKGLDCEGRLRQLSYALWKQTGFEQPFGNRLLVYVAVLMPHDAVGATAELRRWLRDRDPKNWRKAHAHPRRY